MFKIGRAIMIVGGIMYFLTNQPDEVYQELIDEEEAMLLEEEMGGAEFSEPLQQDEGGLIMEDGQHHEHSLGNVEFI